MGIYPGSLCKAHQLGNFAIGKASPGSFRFCEMRIYSGFAGTGTPRGFPGSSRRCICRVPREIPEFGPEQLQEALNELPEGFRTPVILFYFEDMSYRDIAEQMGLPIGTVMSRLARGKAYLRDRLVPSESSVAGEANRGL